MCLPQGLRLLRQWAAPMLVPRERFGADERILHSRQHWAEPGGKLFDYDRAIVVYGSIAMHSSQQVRADNGSLVPFHVDCMVSDHPATTAALSTAATPAVRATSALPTARGAHYQLGVREVAETQAACLRQRHGAGRPEATREVFELQVELLVHSVAIGALVRRQATAIGEREGRRRSRQRGRWGRSAWAWEVERASHAAHAVGHWQVKAAAAASNGRR